MSSILLIDEVAIVRASIRCLLNDVKSITKVYEATDSQSALTILRAEVVDTVIMDLGSDSLSVLDVTRRMLASSPDLKIIVLTNQLEGPFPARLLQAGASACMSKYCSANDLFSAIKAVRKGKRYISTDVAKQLASAKTDNTLQSRFSLLSNRELQIMYMFIKGMRIQPIAEKLFLSPKTVNTYRYRIFEKLGVRGDVEMTHMALRCGVLSQDRWESGFVSQLQAS